MIFTITTIFIVTKITIFSISLATDLQVPETLSETYHPEYILELIENYCY